MCMTKKDRCMIFLVIFPILHYIQLKHTRYSHNFILFCTETYVICIKRASWVDVHVDSHHLNG